MTAQRRRLTGKKEETIIGSQDLNARAPDLVATAQELELAQEQGASATQRPIRPVSLLGIFF